LWPMAMVTETVEAGYPVASCIQCRHLDRGLNSHQRSRPTRLHGEREVQRRVERQHRREPRARWTVGEYQVHCGLTVPIAACNAKSFSITIAASDPDAQGRKSSRRIAAYQTVRHRYCIRQRTRADRNRAGTRGVMPEPKPEAARCAPSDCAATVVHAGPGDNVDRAFS